MKKALEYLNKYKLPILLGFSSLLLFLNAYIDGIWIAVIILTFLVFIFCDVTEMLSVTMFYVFYSGIGVLFIYTILEMFVVILVKYIIGIVQKKQKVFAAPLILTIVIAIVYTCIHYDVTIDGFYYGANFTAFLFSAYLVFVYSKTINVSKCFKYLMLGMVSAGLYSALALTLTNYSFKVIESDRFLMFTNNINCLSIASLFAIAFYVQRIINKKGSKIINLSLIVIASIGGVLSKSKAFMIVWLFLMLYLLIGIIIKYKKKAIFVVVPIAVCLTALGLIFKDKVLDIVTRFGVTSEDGFNLDAFFTDRTVIWRDYFNVIGSNPLIMWFGVGWLSSDVVLIGPHNAFIFLLYRAGIVGIVALISLAILYFASREHTFKISYFNLTVFVTFLILGLEEVMIGEKFMYFFFFGLILISQSKYSELYLADTNFDIAVKKLTSKIFKNEKIKNIIDEIDNPSNKDRTELNVNSETSAGEACKEAPENAEKEVQSPAPSKKS